jgi:hypothetical protein
MRTRTRVLVVLLVSLIAARIGCNSLSHRLFENTQVQVASMDAVAARWHDELRAKPDCAEVSQFPVPADPTERYELTAYFYSDQGLGYGFGRGYGFGQGQLDFTAWEYRRGALAHSPWWQAVNGQLLAEMLEAHFLYTADLPGCAPSDPVVATWLTYLRAPSSMNWYLAHNASIMRGYQLFEALAQAESFAEQIVMVNTLYRVSLADQMVGGSDDLIARFSDPRGPAVDLITAVDRFYPLTYPLTDEDAEIAAILYLVEGNLLEYAAVNQQRVAQHLIASGFPEAEVQNMLPEINIYQELIPGFRPPTGRVVEP